MQLYLNKSKLTVNTEQLLCRAGYVCIYDNKTGQDSMARRLGRGFYPRFHVYLKDQGEQIVLNLHLDQKQPIYQGTTAHNADYDGEAVEKEIERIKNLITHNLQSMASDNNKSFNNMSLLDEIRPQQLSEVDKKQEKKSWWKFWK